MLVSSAYILGWDYLDNWEVIYNKVPKIVPWGTPLVKNVVPDLRPFTSQDCVQLQWNLY